MILVIAGFACDITAHIRGLRQGNVFSRDCLSFCLSLGAVDGVLNDHMYGSVQICSLGDPSDLFRLVYVGPNIFASGRLASFWKAFLFQNVLQGTHIQKTKTQPILPKYILLVSNRSKIVFHKIWLESYISTNSPYEGDRVAIFSGWHYVVDTIPGLSMMIIIHVSIAGIKNDVMN